VRLEVRDTRRANMNEVGRLVPHPQFWRCALGRSQR
jgi:hypothetical protein